MTDLEKAKQILKNDLKTCVLIKGNNIYSSTIRGVKPLLDFLNSGENFNEFSAADKTVGMGAAHLYILLGVKKLWANVISENALNLLKNNGIYVEFSEAVPFIINRQSDGMCPIEKAVGNISDSALALNVIIATLKNLAK